jgi:hypothetical protein
MALVNIGPGVWDFLIKPKNEVYPFLGMRRQQL